VPLINTHFWLATVGIVLYIASMWIAGLMQGLMWRAVNDDGTLTYTFIESIKATHPYYIGRLAGGLVFLAGMLVMVWNMVMTIRGGDAVVETVAAPAAAPVAAATAA
jgi:cytochrome c oxidase cbb3-type subunit 1